MQKKSSRQIAFEILLKIEKDNSYSNLLINSVLKKESYLSPVDKSFITALVYGVTERRITIDYQISLYSSKKIKPSVLVLLRMGAYQILFMDKVPDSAAVNESVKLSKNNNLGFASNFVNAVLRKIAQSGLMLPDANSEGYLSVKYSCSQDVISLWLNSYGFDNTVLMLENSFNHNRLYLRVNTLKITCDELIKILLSEGIKAEKCELIDNCLIVSGFNNSIEKSEAFKTGLFHVQDLSSQLCALLLQPEYDNSVYDLCSSPGGKSFTIAELMSDSGQIKSFDIYPQRVELIKRGAARLGINSIEASVSDASVYNDSLPLSDRVLCDVPCSGLGTIPKKPDIRYKSLADIESLYSLQYQILCNGAEYTKPGGILVYSTCTLNPDENENICDKFLKAHGNFKAFKPRDIKSFSDDYYTFLPHLNNTDGFFVAVFRKES